MRKASFAIGASAALILSAWTCGAALAADEGTATSAPVGSSTKPHLGNGPAVEKSLPSSAPPATTTGTTGATGQNKTVKAMNNNAKAKVDVEGK